MGYRRILELIMLKTRSFVVFDVVVVPKDQKDSKKEVGSRYTNEPRRPP